MNSLLDCVNCGQYSKGTIHSAYVLFVNFNIKCEESIENFSYSVGLIMIGVENF